MNSDIRKAVEVINQRIENLEHIKAMLVEEFGAGLVLGNGKGSAISKRPPSAHTGNRTRIPGLKGNQGQDNGNATRKTELVRFLTEHGPCKRARILKESGMPNGTVAYLLNKNDFVRRSDGTWDVREPKSESLQ